MFDMSTAGQYGSAMDTTNDRASALAGLRGWAERRAQLEEDRPALMAAAWEAGARSVAELARSAGVSRDTVYADLRRKGINYHNRDQDPRLARLVRAVAELAKRFFSPGNPFSQETIAEFGPAMGGAASLLVSFENPELVRAVRGVLAASCGDVERYLGPYLDELRAALDDYLRWRPADGL